MCASNIVPGLREVIGKILQCPVTGWDMQKSETELPDVVVRQTPNWQEPSPLLAWESLSFHLQWSTTLWIMYSGTPVVESLNPRTHPSGPSGCCKKQTQSSEVSMVVWWHGISKEVADLVECCPKCFKSQPLRREPPISTPVPDYPWQTVGSDLFVLNGELYLLVADYYSRYPEVVELTSTTASSIITHLWGIFARHRVQETLKADNSP